MTQLLNAVTVNLWLLTANLCRMKNNIIIIIFEFSLGKQTKLQLTKNNIIVLLII